MSGKSLPQVRRLGLGAALLSLPLAVFAGTPPGDTTPSATTPAVPVASQAHQTPSAHTLHVAAVLQAQRELELKRLSP